MTVAFVAGATGYVGREVVAQLCGMGLETVAHVRPDSPLLSDWRERFQGLGAIVDATPWEVEALARTLGTHRPDVLFCLIGTTRARGRQRARATANQARETYDSVDYGLTRMLLDACRKARVRPRFVYLSALGTSARAHSAYGRARWQAEEAVRESDLPYVIVQPAIITGPDRDDGRPLERVGALLGDGLLAGLAALGGRPLQARYRSISSQELAAALVQRALAPDGANLTVPRDRL